MTLVVQSIWTCKKRVDSRHSFRRVVCRVDPWHHRECDIPIFDRDAGPFDSVWRPAIAGHSPSIRAGRIPHRFASIPLPDHVFANAHRRPDCKRMGEFRNLRHFVPSTVATGMPHVQSIRRDPQRDQNEHESILDREEYTIVTTMMMMETENDVVVMIIHKPQRLHAGIPFVRCSCQRKIPNSFGAPFVVRNEHSPRSSPLTERHWRGFSPVPKHLERGEHTYT
mmetsp:Transcript_18523/g.42890  ORF Transcript_18523/g.42890 Transcript_18523/m.42890 type:complete len:224 (+) Transcript_18523:272-943(+)